MRKIYQRPVISELSARETLNKDSFFASEGEYTEGPRDGETYGPGAS